MPPAQYADPPPYPKTPTFNMVRLFIYLFFYLFVTLYLIREWELGKKRTCFVLAC